MLAAVSTISTLGCGSTSSSSPGGGQQPCTGAGCTAVTLQSIYISPDSSSIAKGTGQPLSAKAVYSDGSEQDVSAAASWATSNASVLTLGAPAGGPITATGVALGTAEVSATWSGVSGLATVQVTAAVAVSLAVSPPSASVATGVLQTFTAIAHFSDGNDQDVSTSATWSSSDDSVASVAAFGVAQGLAAGNATATASFQGFSGSAMLDVSAAAVTSLSVGPATATLAKGTTQQLAAIATYTDGSTQDVTADATWGTADGAVAMAVGGLVSAAAPGSTDASASYAGFTASSRITVTAATLKSLLVSSASDGIPVGLSLPLTATGIFTDNSQQDLTGQVSWSVLDALDPPVVTVSAAGIVHAAAVGSTAVQAELSGVTGQVSVTVTPATLVSIDVAPAVASAAKGTTVAFTATGNYSDDTTLDLTAIAGWTSDSSAVVFSSAAGSEGIALASNEGTVTVTATFGEVSGTAVMTVTLAVLQSIAVTPASVTIPNGLEEQLTALGTFSDGTTQDLTAQAGWIASDPSIAAVSNVSGSKGLVTTLAEGAVTVTAKAFGISGSSKVTVTQAVLQSIAVTPSMARVPAGYQVQLTATGNYSDGSSFDVTAQTTWTSSSTIIATVSTIGSTRGLATGIAPATASMTATLDGISGQATLTVTTAKLVSISVAPNPFAAAVRGTVALTATGTFSDSTTLDVTKQCVWSSSNKSIAWVSKKGVVSGVKAGTVTITAKKGNKRGTAAGTVQ
jgi:uncharacterized protein YjdB